MGGGAKIKSYDRNTGIELSNYTTNLSNIDGITLDCQGRIIVASWSPAQLTRFESSFIEAPFVLLSTGLSNPADLDYDSVNDRVCVPNSGSNTVVLPEVLDCTTAVNELTGYTSFMMWPNPTTGLLKPELHLTEPVSFLVYNIRGTLVASGTLSPNGLLDISDLAPGTYLVEVPLLRRSAKVVRY